MVIDIGWMADHKNHRLGNIDRSRDAVFLFRDGHNQIGDDELAGGNHTWSVLAPRSKTMAMRLTTQPEPNIGQLRAHHSS